MPNFLAKDHPLQSEEDIKKILESLEEVTYSRHFEEDVLPERPNVSKKLIEEHLSSPDALFGFNFEEDRHPWPKYILLFDKSNKYWLRIVVSLRETGLEVVTAHIASKRKNAKDNLLKMNR